jgi:outer membrane immunogenic protein
MKKLFLASIAFTALAAGPALAADRPVYRRPVVVATPMYSWTGPYVGVGAGYGSGRSNQTDPGISCTFFGTCPVGCIEDDDECLPADGSYRLRGGILGGGAGFNWQLGRWVYGVEGDYSWTGISGSSSTCGAASPIPHPCGTDLQSLGTLRGRIGYAAGVIGNWLPYVTGGLAVGTVRGWDALFPASGSDFRAGWTVGAGVETAITQNWTLKVEYLHVDLGSRQTFNVVPSVPETVSLTADVVRLGLSYKFGNYYAPVVTK